ncbi:DUF4352 domain-containing protein [Staphylococcus pseudintermedius]|nr:DUF4352 domain-containing protein [Staphylococcus pseudintermedius]EKC6438807.1 DUF4352 domain-containing protein [Staphylococcus pseudintermedius]
MSEKKELSNEELLRKQEEKFEAYKKEQASKSKKRWLWGCGGCLGVFIILAILFSACTGAFVKEVDKEIKQEGTLKKDKKEEKAQPKKIGETTEIDGVSFTLNSAKYTDERNEFTDVKAEKVLKVDMTIKNNSDKDIPVGGDVKLYLDGKQAKTYPVSNQLLNSLSPGREISGSEGFAINGNPKKIELEFQPLTSFTNKRYIYEIDVK